MKIKLIFLLILFSACSDNDNNDEEVVEIPEVVSYKMDIQPLFESGCINCHGNQGQLSLTTYENTMKGGKTGLIVIPNNGAGSLLIKKLDGSASGQRMPPPPVDPWNQIKISLVKKWIDEGAKNN